MTEADHLIKVLGLEPHPEGGHYRETFRDATSDRRPYSTAIYFLLKANEVSWWHRIDVVEVWHFYRGAPLELCVVRDGVMTRQLLSAEIEKGHAPQLVVPPAAWQMTRSLGDYTLVGCTVAPGFEFSKFELAPKTFVP